MPPHPNLEGLLARIQSDFTYHAPVPAQLQHFDLLREQARTLARTIAHSVPMGREQSTALTRLEECVMHANAGIARNPEAFEQPTS